MTEETYDWLELRERATSAFGAGVSADLEERVLDVFRRHPAIVSTSVEHVAQRFRQGLIRSPWVIFAKHVEEATRAVENVVVSDGSEKARAVKRAEQWMRTAGVYFDRVEEVDDELFVAAVEGEAV